MFFKVTKTNVKKLPKCNIPYFRFTRWCYCCFRFTRWCYCCFRFTRWCYCCFRFTRWCYCWGFNV